MKRVSLTMKGFLGYEAETTIEYNAGEITAVTGRNGSGKTSIPDAISWVRYGRLRVKGDPDGVINDFCDEAVVTEIAESQSGFLWKFVRRKRRDRQQTLLVSYYDEESEQWEAYGGKNLGENQRQVNELVGMSINAFHSLSVFESRSGNRGIKLVSADRDQRIPILTSLRPNLGIWPEIHKLVTVEARDAKRDYAEAQSHLTESQKRSDDLAAEIDELRDQILNLGDKESLAHQIEEAQSELSSLIDSDVASRIDLLRTRQRAEEAEYQNKIEREKNDLGDIQEEIGEAQNAREHLEHLNTEVEEITEEIADSKADLTKAKASKTRLENTLRDRESEVMKSDSHEQIIESQIESMNEHLDDLEERLRAAEASQGKCVVCGSKITERKAKEIADAIRDDIEENVSRVEELESERDDERKSRADSRKAREKAERSLGIAEKQIANATKAIRKLELELREATVERDSQAKILEKYQGDSISTLEKRADAKRKSIASLTKKLSDAIGEIKDEIKDLKESVPRSRDIQAIERKLDRLKADRDVVVSGESSIATLVAAAQRESKAFQEKSREVREMKTVVEDYELLKTATSQQGIPYLMLSDMLSNIEDKSDEILARINGDDSMAVRLLQDAEDGKPSLDIMVSFPDGSQRPVEALSNGEVTRVSLSLMFALAYVINTSRPGTVQDVFLDEPLAAIDSSGIEGVMAALRTVIAEGIVTGIFVVAHDQSIIDACDSEIDIEQLKAAAT